MLLQIIIISYNCREYTVNCIESIYNTFSESVDIIVVDNNSSDDTIEFLRANYPNIKTIQNSENLGYSKAVNIGAKAAKAEYILISNADVIYQADAVQNMLDFIKANPKYALIGPRQFFPNGKAQFSGGGLPSIKLIIKNFLFLNYFSSRLYFGNVSHYDYIDGAVLLCSSKAFWEAGGFTEDFFFYSEDAEFSLKIKNAGYKIGTYNKAKVFHFRGVSTNINGINQNAIEMFVKAKIKLADMLLPKYLRKSYLYSELATTLISKYLYTLLSLIFKRDSLHYKKEYAKLLLKKWKESI